MKIGFYQVEMIKITLKNNTLEFINELPESIFIQAKKAISAATINVYVDVLYNTMNVLKVRTGKLKQSIQYSIIGNNLNNLRASVWSDVSYAKIQETGGIIIPSKYKNIPGGPYLSIPIGFNLDSRGVMRFNSKQVFSNGGFIKKPNRKWLIFDKIGRPMFVLVKQVRIPPRLGMIKAQENAIPQLLNDLEKF